MAALYLSGLYAEVFFLECRKFLHLSYVGERFMGVLCASSFLTKLELCNVVSLRFQGHGTYLA